MITIEIDDRDIQTALRRLRQQAGHPLVRLRRRIGDEEWNLVFEVRRRRRMLSLNTLYIRRVKADRP